MGMSGWFSGFKQSGESVVSHDMKGPFGIAGHGGDDEQDHDDRSSEARFHQVIWVPDECL